MAASQSPPWRSRELGAPLLSAPPEKSRQSLPCPPSPAALRAHPACDRTFLSGTRPRVESPNPADPRGALLRLSSRGKKLSTSKGLIAGNLRYMEEDGTSVHCTCGSTAVAVPSNIQGIRNLITDAKFLLIVEKDATFQRLLDDNFCNRMSPCIMVTGKGVPDLNTRLLVKKLWDTFHIPVFALVDADPHGIEIMCIYKYGSMVKYT
ncbi:meiotic recombination protein SPO11 isoform X2 [Halichoerus grypus]